MGEEISRRLIASKGVGQPISLTILGTGDSELEEALRFSMILARVHLRAYDFQCFTYAIHGSRIRGRIENYSKKWDTEDHEEMHAELSDVWPGANSCFKEGFAYAWGHREKDSAVLDELTVYSQSLCRIYSLVANNGFDSECCDGSLIGKLIETTPPVTLYNNMRIANPLSFWVKFSEQYRNHAYFSLFSHILQSYGFDEGKEICLEGAEFGRDNGIKSAISYISSFAHRSVEIIDIGSSQFKNMSSNRLETLIQSPTLIIPITTPETYSGHWASLNMHVLNCTKSLRVNIRSAYQDMVLSVSETLEEGFNRAAIKEGIPLSTRRCGNAYTQ